LSGLSHKFGNVSLLYLIKVGDARGVHLYIQNLLCQLDIDLMSLLFMSDITMSFQLYTDVAELYFCECRCTFEAFSEIWGDN
jgi:hypothetical protein